MLNFFLLFAGKVFSNFSRYLNLGNGSTWPGHIALSVNKNFIKQVIKNSSAKVIFVAGTNGKTTTSSIIRTILEENGNSVFQNQSGANLLNGIASSLISETNSNGRINAQYAIFEIDENTLHLAINEVTPDYV